MMKSLILILLVGAATAQDDLDAQFSGPKFNFRCPEPNGKFRDPEQCDLYYVCTGGEFEALLCQDGLLFDDSKVNYEVCKLPHDVDCGERAFVQEPQKGIDPRCLTELLSPLRFAVRESPTVQAPSLQHCPSDWPLCSSST